MHLLTASLCIAVTITASSASAQTPAAAPQTSATPATPAAPPADDPHAAQPERPSVATHAGTVAPGWLELESGVEFDRYKDTSRSTSIPTLFKIGLAPRVQLGIQAPLVRPESGSTGFGDVSMGVKFRLIEDHPLLGDFAVLPSIKFASGSTDTGAGTGTTDGSLLLISSRKIGDVSLDLNVGITRRSGDGTDVPRTSTLWTVSFGGPLAGNVGWGAEIYGYPSTSGPAGADSIVALLVGPSWAVRDWFVVDTGVIVKLTGDQPNAIYAGLTWNVGNLRR